MKERSRTLCTLRCFVCEGMCGGISQNGQSCRHIVDIELRFMRNMYQLGKSNLCAHTTGIAILKYTKKLDPPLF